MDLSTIKIALQDMPELSEQDLEKTLQHFVQENEGATVNEFAMYLHRNKLIDTRVLGTVLAQTQIEITDYSYLDTPDSETDDAPLINSDQTYDILGPVGEGGMGEILLAKDSNLLRTVAYKKLHEEFAQNKVVLGQFINEVQITSQLEHPNVIPIYNLEVSEDGAIAYSMKLVQGETLKELIATAREAYDRGEEPEQSHSLTTLLEHFLKVCDALELAHSKQVLHRDLKPANIMIGAFNEVSVMDWGIACIIGQVKEKNKQAVGTPRYMSPEQAGGLNHLLDARSDIFSLGLILFEVVTLNSAVPHETQAIETLKHIIRGEFNPIEHYQAGRKIPSELEAIIRKCTSRKRVDRYQSVGDLAADIRRYLRGDAVLAQPDTFFQSIGRWISQNREKTLAAILLILLLSAGSLSSSLYYRHTSLIKMQAHEDQIHRAVTIVAERGNAIDQHFFYLEGLLRSFGTAVLQRVHYGQPTPGTFYTLQDYQNPSTRPANTRFIEKYSTEVNIDWGMILNAPGSDPLAMRAANQIMHPLQYVMKQTVIDSYGERASSTLSQAEIDQLILERKMPILWIFTALESGFYTIYPSTYNYREGYDPRQRPWYKMGKAAEQLKWGEPYRTTGGEVDLPCVMPLYDQNKEFQGVAVIEMTFDYIQNHFLNLDISGVEESALVNQKGEIIISTIDHYQAGRSQDLKADKTALVSVDSEQVKADLLKKQSGYFIEDTPEGKEIYLYYYISSLGWYYLIRADEPAFLAQMDLN